MTLPHETQATVVVNVALLFAVSVEPFLFWVMASGGHMLEATSMAYSLDMWSMLLLRATLDHLLLVEQERSHCGGVERDTLARIRRRMWDGAAVGVLFCVSAFPVFWAVVPGNSTLRIDLWYVGLVLILVLPRLASGRRPPME